MLVDAYIEQGGTELINQNIFDIYSPDFQHKWAFTIPLKEIGVE